MLKSSNNISKKLDDYENVKVTFNRKPKESPYRENRNTLFGKSNFGNNGKEDRKTFARPYPEQRDFGRQITTNRQGKKFEKQKSSQCYEGGEMGHVRSFCSEFLRKNTSMMNKTNEEEVSDAHVARNSNIFALKTVQKKKKKNL